MNLYVKTPSGRYAVAEPAAIHAAAVQLTEARISRGTFMAAPNVAAEYCVAQLSHELSEVFAVMFLDSRHRLIEFKRLFQGTIDSANVYPREVVKAALACNAAAVILTHNHPSGLAEPSDADRRITTRLVDALALIDVRVLDHIVVGGLTHVSMASRGIL